MISRNRNNNYNNKYTIILLIVIIFLIYNFAYTTNNTHITQPSITTNSPRPPITPININNKNNKNIKNNFKYQDKENNKNNNNNSKDIKLFPTPNPLNKKENNKNNNINIENNIDNNNKMSSRIVSKIATGMSTSDGAGVKLKRVIGGPISDLDPFLLLDEFKSDDPNQYMAGFPSHPHRGFETVTYMLKGTMEHKDHVGNHGLLKAGSVQWMTAGKGIIHSEIPILDKTGEIHGFQLWVNLPSTHKMIDPRYQDIPPKDIPTVIEENGSKIRVIVGEYKNKTGPIKGIVTDPLYLDVQLTPGSTFSETIPFEHAAFVYVFDGSGRFGPKNNLKEVKTSQIGILQQGGNRDRIDVIAGDSDAGVRFLLIAGMPIKEPISRYGPFVMNTEAEIRQAFKDYQSGKF